MFSLLFRNRWFAVGYVVVTLISASVFVGQGGGAQQLAQTTRQLQAQRAAYSAEVVRPVVVKTAPPPSPQPSLEPAPEGPLLQALPGSNADPANPKIGDVFVNLVTGQRVRAVRREDAGKYQPAFPGQAYSSSAPSP